MRDWLAVQLSGAVSLPKARVLYKEGTFKIFDKRGHVATLHGGNPTRVKGWRRTWETYTNRGRLTMNGRCIACGGWVKVAVQNGEQLWQSAK